METVIFHIFSASLARLYQIPIHLTISTRFIRCLTISICIRDEEEKIEMEFSDWTTPRRRRTILICVSRILSSMLRFQFFPFSYLGYCRNFSLLDLKSEPSIRGKDVSSCFVSIKIMYRMVDLF